MRSRLPLPAAIFLEREHGISVDVVIDAVKILAALADGERAIWRQLAHLQDHPLYSALSGCDNLFTEALYTTSEVLQFPKPVSTRVQQHLAVLRVRRAAAAGESETVALVRAEPVLAPLLEQAATLVEDSICKRDWSPQLALARMPALWRGFFGDAEDVESLDSGRRELDHITYCAGRVLGGRRLLPDLLEGPPDRCARESIVLSVMGALAGEVDTISTLHHTGRPVDRKHCARVAARFESLAVLRFVASLGFDFIGEEGEVAQTAARADLTSSKHKQALSTLIEFYPSCVYFALPACARSDDAECVRWLLADYGFDDETLEFVVEHAASGGHIPVLQVLLEKGAPITAGAFRASADVATLQRFVEQGCSVDVCFVDLAAASGRLFQLQWAASVVDITDFLTADVFWLAAYSDNVATFEWLHARGCPWDKRTLDRALARHNWPCLVFALRHGCPLRDITCTVLGLARMPLEGLKSAVQALRDGGRGELVGLAELF
jgi:hypothetical protein